MSLSDKGKKPMSISPSRLQEILAKARAKNPGVFSAPIPAEITKPVVITEILPAPVNDYSHSTDRYGQTIELNEQQQEFVRRVASGESCVLIGAAGSGKTTSTKQGTHAVIQAGHAGILDNSHKHLVSGTPGIVCCAYTRRAVSNIRKNMSEEMKNNCITIHKLLQYEPVYDTVYDPETGDERTTMRFVATRNANNPLPPCIKVIIIEEASMCSVELFNEIVAACPHNPQFIFLGDIQQLPPVFGSAILGFKMLELPTIELTEIYRQALESPIIRLAHRILSGKPIPETEFNDWKVPGLTIRPWKKKLSADVAVIVASKTYTALLDGGEYSPEEDMILCPFNKGCGTDEINRRIATHIARKNDRLVYEIVAGFNKLYFSVGEKVLVEKEDATIISIKSNPTYLGASYLEPSKTLDYFGYDPEGHSHSDEDLDVDKILELASSDNEDRVRKCSHIIRVRMNDSEQEIDIQTAADVNAMLYGYCLTVHKAQGSEWRKVFLLFHQSHATMLQRELLYTAVTRAKEELVVFCEPETFEKGVIGQRIKGNTLAEKAEFFKGKVDAGYLER